MTSEDLTYLQTEEAQDLLARYQDTPVADLPRLTMKLKKQGCDQAHLITSQLNLRAKASNKFSRAESMLFTPEGLEQATPEPVARHIARKFAKHAPEGSILDLTCGLGGNALALAEYRPVRALDSDPVILELARHNSAVYEVENRISFQQADIQREPLPPGAAFFLDPARAGERPSKTRSLFNTEPPLDSVLPYLLEHIPHGGVKISPAFDYAELDHLPESPEVELIGYGKHNAVAMLRFGCFAHYPRSATVLTADGTSYHLSADSSPSLPSLSDPHPFLFEPHPALRKAHLISETAERFGFSQIDAHLSFLTASHLPENTALFRIFRVHEVKQFSWPGVRDLLSSYNLSRGEIMTRAFPYAPEDIRSHLKLAEGNSYTLLFTTLQDTLVCLLLERLSSFD